MPSSQTARDLAQQDTLLSNDETLDGQLMTSITSSATSWKDGDGILAPNELGTLEVTSGPVVPAESQMSTPSDVENYDTQPLDPSALVGGEATRVHQITSPPGNKAEKPPLTRRSSIPVKLEKTSRKGRYILTLDDAELKEILQSIEERTLSNGSRSKLRDLVFTRRFTTFDRQSPRSIESPFRGFFTLAWLCIALMLLRVAAQNWRIHGNVLGRNELMQMMFGYEVIVMGITDAVMCLATGFGWVLHKAIAKGFLTWNGSGWIIESVWQAFYLWAFVAWSMYREWPWTHTIFIVLHALVYLMKQHSYTFYNGYLSQVYRRKVLLDKQLNQLNAMSPLASPAFSRTFSTPTVSSYEDLRNGEGIRNRQTGKKYETPNLSIESSQIASVAALIASGKALDSDQMEAFKAILTAEITALDQELKGKCTTTDNYYPTNLTLANFADWTILPTLVYELEYPRQEYINWWYVLEKSAATFGGIGVMMAVSQAYIYPLVADTVSMKERGMTLQQRWTHLPWVVSDILFPLMLEQLLTWYVIWECVLNVLAEVTKFADRGFYGDWWNCVSWDDYARLWNRPVHNFLLRHVYHSSISAFKMSKMSATFFTFFLSACVHELLMYCLFKKVRGYLFTMQLLQIPLAALSRTPLLKGRKTLGNVIFWFGLFFGPSILTALYLIV